ncbi:MAG: XRE family transcriptional regulator [Gemmobacter sp.]|nr:XRE family transcriptional regulator [Gemmobacter sp.]
MSPEGPKLGKEVGPRIRRHRLGLGLSLVDLSGRSGVSVSNISKIETGKIVGGFQAIYRICRGLGILVTDLLEENQPAAGSLRVVRRGEAEVQETALYSYVPLSTRPGGRLNAAIMEVHSRSLPDLVDWSNHSGEEVVTVLSGSIALHYEGQEPIILNEGDSANFESAPRHCYVCRSDTLARLLFVSTRSGRDAPAEEG